MNNVGSRTLLEHVMNNIATSCAFLTRVIDRFNNFGTNMNKLFYDVHRHYIGFHQFLFRFFEETWDTLAKTYKLKY